MTHAASLSFNRETKRITLRGTLSFSTCMVIFNQSLAMMRETESHIEVDFSEMNCIDSSIVALLVEWCKYMNDHHYTLRVLNLPEHIHSLLNMAGLNEVLAGLFI